MTGGTGDVNPQQMTVALQQGAANTYVEVQVANPVIRLPTRKGKTIVMEVIKVSYVHSPFDTNPAAGGALLFSRAGISTVSHTAAGAVDYGQPTTFSYSSIEERGAFTAAGSYATSYKMPNTDELEDGDAHGYLVATDSLFFAFYTGGYANVGYVDVKLTYRFKEVSLEEYIGIVQQQQQS